MGDQYRSAISVGRASASIMANVARHIRLTERSVTGLIAPECVIDESIVLPALMDATGKADLALQRDRAFDVYSCGYAYPHTDDAIGDISIGLVVSGNHMLYTGLNKRTRVHLETGSVFLLNNKKVHGADCLSVQIEPLVFAVKDLFFESIRDAVVGLGLVGRS